MELFEGFTRGLNPDFNDPDQVKLFEMYRVSRFGDATPGTIPQNYVELILAFRKAHPGIAKKYFREVTYVRQDFVYPPVAKLDNGKKLHSIWHNIQTMRAEIDKFLKVDKKALVSERRLTEKDFVTLFGEKEEDHHEWRNLPHREVTIKNLFNQLLRLRKQKKAAQESTKFIDQTILDIANTIGFEKGLVEGALKDKDASSYEKLKALRQGIYAREDFAGDMAQFVEPENLIPGGYQGLLKELGLRKASKLSDDGNLTKDLAAVETEMRQKAEKVDGEKMRVRQLSPAEEALRSCLGGDCSSRTYFEKAMEADYVYFTQTNTIHESMGHATLVLGEADGVKVAMLDKLQNIPNEEIPYFIESIRRSLLQDGYALGIPEDLGDHNGLSNYGYTREFVGNELDAYTRSEKTLTGFKPHSASIKDPLYSRAYKNLSLRVVKPLSRKLREAAKIRTGSKYEPVPMGRASMDSMVAEMRLRKNSPHATDHFEYVHTVMALLRAGVDIDPDYKSAIQSWLADANSPVTLKNSIVRNQLERARGNHLNLPEFVESLHILKPRELSTVIQNWSQVSAYQDYLAEKFDSLGPARYPLALENSHAMSPDRAIRLLLNLHAADSNPEVSKEITKRLVSVLPRLKPTSEGLSGAHLILQKAPRLILQNEELRSGLESKFSEIDQQQGRYSLEIGRTGAPIYSLNAPESMPSLLSVFETADARMKPLYFAALASALTVKRASLERFELGGHEDVFKKMAELLSSKDPVNEFWATRFFSRFGKPYPKHSLYSEGWKEREEIFERRLKSADIETAQDAAGALTNFYRNVESPRMEKHDAWEKHPAEFARVIRFGDSRVRAQVLDCMGSQRLADHPELKSAVNDLLSSEQPETILVRALSVVGEMDEGNVRQHAALFLHPSEAVRSVAITSAWNKTHLLTDAEVEPLVKAIQQGKVEGRAAIELLRYRVKAGGGFSQNVLDAVMEKVEPGVYGFSDERTENKRSIEGLFSDLRHSEAVQKLVAADLSQASEEKFEKYNEVIGFHAGKHVHKALADLLAHSNPRLRRSARLLITSKDPLILRKAASLLLTPHRTWELVSLLEESLKEEPRGGEVVRKAVAKSLRTLALEDVPSIVGDLFDEHSDRVGLLAHVGAVVRQNETVRKAARDYLSDKSIKGLAYVLKPELEEDRRLLEELRRKLGTESDVHAESNALIDRARRDFPMEGAFYDGLSSLNTGEHWWMFESQVRGSVPEGIRPQFMKLIERRELIQQLAGIGHTLNARIHSDADAERRRSQTYDRCAKALARIQRP